MVFFIKKLISSMSNDNRNLSSLIFQEKLIFLSRAVACVECHLINHGKRDQMGSMNEKYPSILFYNLHI